MGSRRVVEMLLIVPSRGRPHSVTRFISSITETSGEAPPHVLFVVDSDDEKLDEYLETLKDTPDWVSISVKPRVRLAASWNDAAVDAASSFDILGFFGDDNVFRTRGWRERVETSMQAGGIVYGNDTVHGANLPTAAFLDSKIVSTLGRMTAPGMVHLYLDNVWQAWGRETGRFVYLDDVIIEHVHPIKGAAPWDETYAEANSDEMYDVDGSRFNEYCTNGELALDVEKLKNITSS